MQVSSIGKGRGPNRPGSSYASELPRTVGAGNRVSENTLCETVRKGYEQRSERGFGRYMEHKMDRKAPPWRPVRLRWERLRDFSDSLCRRSVFACLQGFEASGYIPHPPGPIKLVQAWWRQSINTRLKESFEVSRGRAPAPTRHVPLRTPP